MRLLESLTKLKLREFAPHRKSRQSLIEGQSEKAPHGSFVTNCQATS
jgi:hypothetical protein